MPKQLDKSRGYGEVIGHEGGAFFEQDGVLFDADGIELFNEEVTPAAPRAASKSRAKPKAEPASPVLDQLTQQLQGEEGGLES